MSLQMLLMMAIVDNDHCLCLFCLFDCLLFLCVFCCCLFGGFVFSLFVVVVVVFGWGGLKIICFVPFFI